MDIQEEIIEIKERNKRVETDKAWEQSFVRRFFITLATYIIAGIWLIIINEVNPWLKALVPTGGYVLSTLSLSILRKLWAKKQLF